MSGNHSRRKGANFEREAVALFQQCGLSAERVPLSGAVKGGSFEGDILCAVCGETKRFEAKRRASGFKQLYAWLGSNFGLVVRDDRCEPLVVLRLEDFARLVN